MNPHLGAGGHKLRHLQSSYIRGSLNLRYFQNLIFVFAPLVENQTPHNPPLVAYYLTR